MCISPACPGADVLASGLASPQRLLSPSAATSGPAAVTAQAANAVAAAAAMAGAAAGPTAGAAPPLSEEEAALLVMPGLQDILQQLVQQTRQQQSKAAGTAKKKGRRKGRCVCKACRLAAKITAMPHVCIALMCFLICSPRWHLYLGLRWCQYSKCVCAGMCCRWGSPAVLRAARAKADAGLAAALPELG
jgi:hypothetical protein